MTQISLLVSLSRSKEVYDSECTEFTSFMTLLEQLLYRFYGFFQ
jgi:hypothetical protein